MKRIWLALVGAALLAAALAQGTGGARGPSTARDTWYANAVFYQVFVRSFQDSNADGIGDLRGLTSRLDDLKNLGVTALWLNPINPSPSYHGYDVTDYTGINPQYGNLEDFDAFLIAAHARGMKVILDYVPNHTSSQHPWFLESRNPNSPKRDWYLWRDRDPGWKNPLGSPNSPWRLAPPVQTAMVVFPGSIQAALGATAWNPSGTEARAVETSSGIFELVVRLPAGRYEYKVALGGTWAENYGQGGAKDGQNIAITVPNEQIVRFRFDRTTRKITDSVNDPTGTPAPASLPPRPTFTDTAPSSAKAYYYAPFWEGMPDLNWRNPEVKKALFDAARFWLDRDVDGFRVDAVRYLFEGQSGTPADATPDQPETLNWSKDFTQFVKGVNPEAVVVTEAWADTETVAKYFVNGQGQQLGFNFDLQRAIRQTANAARPDTVKLTLERVAAAYPPSAVDAIFTGNHDLERMRFFNAGRYRSAATLLLTLPGTPFIYYGEEIGMPGGPSNRDEDKRTPMRWDDTPNAGFSTVKPWYTFSTTEPEISVSRQKAQSGSLYTLYKNLIRLRQASPALRAGGYVPVSSGNDRVYAFVRNVNQDSVVVVVNLDSDAQNAVLNLSPTPLENTTGTVRELTMGKTLAPLTPANRGKYPLKLSPYGFVLLEVKGQ
jgi:glycosidase